MNEKISQILELAKEKLSYKDPNISFALDEARAYEQYMCSVGSQGLFMSSRGKSFEEAANTLIVWLEDMK